MTCAPPTIFLGQCEVLLKPNSPIFGKGQNLILKPRNDIHDSIVVHGSLNFLVSYYPGEFQHKISYKYHNHAFTGLVRSMGTHESVRVYATYQIKLKYIPEIFDEIWQPWNRKYEAANKIFGSAVIKSTVVTQHRLLYSEMSVAGSGVLGTGEDLLKLLHHGIIDGKPRIFTYAITDDTWFFSETGATFFCRFYF